MTLDELYTASGIALVAGNRAVWDDNGALLGGWSADPIRAGALTIDSDFRVHPNGKLHLVTISADAKLAGIDFPKRAQLTFRAGGSLEAARYIAKQGFMIHGEPWHDTRDLTFDAAGKVTSDRTDHFQSTERPPKFRK